MYENYFKAYCDSRTAASNIKTKIITNHIHHYEVLEELLGYQYFLNQKFASLYKSLSNKDQIFKKYSNSLLNGVSFTYNVQFLQIGLESVELDYIHIAASNLRSVFEAIPKMFYLSIEPERIPDVLIHEYIQDFTYDQVNKKLEKIQNKSNDKDKDFEQLIEHKIPSFKHEDLEKFIENNTLPFKNENIFGKFKNKKYTPAWFRNQLYDDVDSTSVPNSPVQLTHRGTLQSLYGKLSDSSHSNILRNMVATDYDPINTNFFFEMLKSLSYWNIYVFLEVNYSLLWDMGLIKTSLEFLNSIGVKYPTMGADKNMKPTIPHMVKKSNIRPRNSNQSKKL